MEAIDESGLEPVRSPDEIDDAHVAWAYWLMVRDWLGINGVSGTTRTNHHPALRLTPNGGGGASRWAAVVGSIPAWVERVRAIQIVRRDVFELLPDVDDDKGVFVYLDPPYVLGSRGSVRTRYAHDVPRGADAERAWHTRLRDQAARFKSARVMLSYYEHPMLRELYTPADGWTIRPVPVSKSMASITARKANKGTALEIVILNAAAAADTGPNLFTAHEPESENP
jgi:hypothetical protein